MIDCDLHVSDDKADSSQSPQSVLCVAKLPETLDLLTASKEIHEIWLRSVDINKVLSPLFTILMFFAWGPEEVLISNGT